MKIQILLIIYFTVISFNSVCQVFNTPEIELNDIEKGIKDFDFLRIKLLENGFELNKKEENTGDYVLMEFWEREKTKNHSTSYGMQISKIPFNKTTYLNVISISGFGENFEDLSIKLTKQIKNKYETKIVENLKYDFLGEKREKYELVYSTQRNNIKVTMENSRSGFIFVFKVYYPK